MTNPATEAFERLFAELARKWDQTQEPGDLMQILTLINSRFSALELRFELGQPSAAAEPATRLPVSMYEMLRAEGLSDERAWVYLDLLRSENSDHAQESQPAPAAGQAKPCGHEWRIGGYTFAPPVKEPKTVYLYCTWCDMSRRFSWVPAQAEGNEPR